MPTHARYCQNPVVETDAPCDSPDAVADENLTLAPSPQEERRAHPYHRMTLRWAAWADFPPELGLGVVRPLEYVNREPALAFVRELATWDYFSDFVTWTQANATQEFERMALPPRLADPHASAASGLNGVVWLHGDTAVGDTTNLGTGLHGEQLANAFISVQTEEVVVRPIGPGPRTYWPGPVFWMPPDPVRPLGVDNLVVPWLRDRPAREGRLVAVVPQEQRATVLAADGRWMEATPLLGTSLMAALSSPQAQLIAASEPARDRPGRSAVLVSTDGTRVLDAVTRSAGYRALAEGDLEAIRCGPGQVAAACDTGPRCVVPCNGVRGDSPTPGVPADPTCIVKPSVLAPPGESAGGSPLVSDEAQCEAGGETCEAGSLACGGTCGRGCESPTCLFACTVEGMGPALPAGGTRALPGPRSGFASAFSSTLQRVFIVGGLQPNGTQAGDVWTGALGDDLTRLVQPGALGVPLAATYSASERALYVIDEVRHVPWSARWARLVRVDAVTGTVTELGRWLRLGVFGAPRLVADRDGSLLIAASSDRLKRFVIVRVDPARRRVVDVVFGASRLVAGPLLDETGYLLARVERDGALRYDHRAQLTGSTGSWADIGQCF